jgi:pentatricopeptide repeat protein
LRVCLKLVENLVGIGLELNLQHYNIIMLNAAEAGDLETVARVYAAAGEQGFTPDKYTCAIRLKACKSDVDNIDLLRDAIQDAITNGEARTEQLVAGEILHCLTLHHSKHNPKTAFETVFAAYIQFHDPGPLKLLRLNLPEVPLPAEDASYEPTTPSQHAVTYLLWIYLRYIATPQEATELYMRWRQLVRAGEDPVLSACAATTNLSNIFLRHFSNKRLTLLQATQVVKDMQQPLPPEAGVTQAPPDAYTWSTFMHGFARRGETRLAEQVLTYMRNKGIEPNEVTWNSLIQGYARAQDEDGLLDTLRRSDEGGVMWDDWTRRGLRWFRNKERLRVLLERQKFERSLDFTQDLTGQMTKRLTDGGVEITQPAQPLSQGGESTMHLQKIKGRERVHPEGFADTSADLAEMPGLVEYVPARP